MDSNKLDALFRRKTAKKPSALTLMEQAGADWWVLRFDGSCVGNGRANATGKWGYHLSVGDTTLSTGSGKATGNPVTNNVAEWQGLISGLEKYRESQQGETSCPGLLIEGDSQLVIRMLKGEWGSKFDHLLALRQTAWDTLLATAKPWSAGWIRRDKNEFCDSLTR